MSLFGERGFLEVLVFEQGTWRKDRALYNAIRASSFANLVLTPHQGIEIFQN